MENIFQRKDDESLKLHHVALFFFASMEKHLVFFPSGISPDFKFKILAYAAGVPKKKTNKNMQMQLWL